jgi:hypothetical protein
MTLPDDYRLSIDRDCIPFQSVYALRTECERYNSRFKQSGQERLWIHNKSSAENLNSIAHISMLAIASASIFTHSSSSYRSAKTAPSASLNPNRINISNLGAMFSCCAYFAFGNVLFTSAFYPSLILQRNRRAFISLSCICFNRVL